MKRKKSRKIIHDSRGFSLIEVLLGISIFMIGMLGVTALNISSLKSNTFSGNLSEATLIAATKIEELMTLEFDDIAGLSDLDNDGSCFDVPGVFLCPGGFKNQDVDDDGMDDDDPDDTAANVDNKPNFGLDDNTVATADYSEGSLGKNGIYTVYWNVAENEPISVTNPDPVKTKTINVIVEWYVKEEPRRINMQLIRMKD